MPGILFGSGRKKREDDRGVHTKPARGRFASDQITRKEHIDPFTGSKRK